LRTRLINILDRLRTNFWFVPALMAIGAIVLAIATMWIDEGISDDTIREWRWLYTGGAEAARQFLSTIASSVITVAGVVFSITIVVLSLASQQLGPRLLRTFMRDRVTQFVLGTFVSTFVFCMLVLRSVREIYEEPLVPHISVSVAAILALLSLAVLIYFIHHVSERIQAHYVIAEVAGDLQTAVETLFPRRLGEPPDALQPDDPAEDIPADFEQQARPIPAFRSGYLQAIDNSGLLELAVKHDLVLRLNCRPGHFIVKGSDLMWACPSAHVTDQVIERINGTFILARQRTLTQDAEFAIEQLVEIAVRALSTGINDPFTAINCIDHLTASLCEISGREMPHPYRYDHEGRLRTIAYPQTFSSIVDQAFNQIRQHIADEPAVAIRMLDGIAIIGRCVRQREGRQTLLAQVMALYKACQRAIEDEKDLHEIEHRYLAAVRALGSE
jgi:uncharacterized membrane protein